MNKRLSFLLTATILVFASNTSWCMDHAQRPLFNMEGHLIPDNYTVSVSPNSLFSLLGLVVSCLGGLLIYQGAQKIAEPIALPLPAARAQHALNPSSLIEPAINNTTTTQGKWLTVQGLLLATAGIVAIFHQKIFNS